VLDPIFIFVFKLGIEGAAIATVIAQCVSLVWIFKMLTDKREFLHLSKESFGFDWTIAKRSLSIGLAPFLMNVASCFVVIFINNQLKRYSGDLAIGAYGIINRLVFLFVMMVFGFNQGMQPIAGYNYGAKQYDRVLKVLNLTSVCGICVTTVCFIVGMFFPQYAVRLFTRDEELIEMAAHAFRIAVIIFPIVGRQMVVANFFQSLGLAQRAIFLSLSRQLLFLLPCLAILPLFFGLEGIWYSMPCSDILAVFVAEILLFNLKKKFKANAIKAPEINNI